MKALFGVLLLLVICIPSDIAAKDKVAPDDGFDELSNTETTVKSAPSDSDNWFAEDSTSASVSPDKPAQHAVYPLIPIGSITILLYFITWLCSKIRIIQIATHRKIWNFVLLIAFLVSGILGLILVFQINYNVLIDWYNLFINLHVDFGILLAIISIFHILWHTKYYMSLFKKKQQSTQRRK